MFITLNSQNRTTGSVDVDIPSNFVNMFNENIIIPKNSVVGVHSVSVNVSGDIVIDGTNDSIEIDYGSVKITVNIPHGSYKIIEQTSGDNPVKSYPLIDALNHALTNAISTVGFAQQLPPAKNKFSVVSQGGQVFVRLDLSESGDEVYTTGTLLNSTNTLKNGVGEIEFSGNKIKNIKLTEGAGLRTTAVMDGNAIRSFGSNGNPVADRYGEAIIKPSKTLGMKYKVGLFLQANAGNTSNSVFEIGADNKISIVETDSVSTEKCRKLTTFEVQADGNMWLKAVLPLTMASAGNRVIKYYVNNSTTHADDQWRLVDMSSFSSAERNKANVGQRYFVGAYFIDGAKVRPNATSLTSSSGQWSITTPGSGLTVGVLMTMASKTSTNGVITNGSVNISSVSGGACDGFDMTNSAVLPDFGATGSFVNGDTITFNNGVVITKTATTLTTDFEGTEIESIEATTVNNPVNNPMVRNNVVAVDIEPALADLIHLPVRDNFTSVMSGKTTAYHKVGSSGLNATNHQPEIFVNCPTLNINSRNNKNSSNTLTRFPLGQIDSQGERVGHHYHESYNIMYHKITGAEDININQLTIQLQDKDGANLNQLLHPSVVSLHIHTPSK